MATRTQKFVLAMAALALLAVLALLVSKLMGSRSGTVRHAPKISLFPAAPPPPPPPPKEEKRPEPPKEQKEVKMEQAPPKEAPPAPPSQELKMDGPAGDGPSAFAAGKVTREDFTNIGKGGGGGPPVAAQPNSLFNPFANYATAIKGELQRQLSRSKELRQQAYRVDLQLWVGRDGRVTRHELVGSTGDTDIDELIRQAIAGVAFSLLPPEQMPQPIRLRVVTGRR